MRHLRKISGGGWIAVGVVAGVILAPAAAVAGTSLVGIIGSNGQRAEVTHGGQLQAAEAAPFAFREFFTSASGACHKVATAPATRAFLIKDVSANAFADPTPGAGNKVTFYTDSQCNNEVFDINPGSVGVTTIPVDPGFAVPAGHSLWAEDFDGVQAETYITGYLVPTADASGFTVATRATGPRVSNQ